MPAPEGETDSVSSGESADCSDGGSLVGDVEGEDRNVGIVSSQYTPQKRVFSFTDAEATGGAIEIFGNFDSANVARVQKKDTSTFWIWVSPDADGTEFCTTFRSWFYFGVRNVPQGRRIKFVIRNCNKQGNLYKHQYRPVYRALPTMPDWKHLRLSASYDFDSSHGIVTFEHVFEDSKASAVYFAHFFPFSYSDHKIALQTVESVFGNRCLVPQTPSPVAESPNLAASLGDDQDSVYFARELLGRTPERRDIDLLTITSADSTFGPREKKYHKPGLFPDFGKTVEKEYMVDQKTSQDINEPDCHGSIFSLSPASFARSLAECEPKDRVFQQHKEYRVDRPHSFPLKPVIFISSRVHPGETPASFVMNGILRFLLNEKDSSAKMLRRLFVFKIIPILNPDGVANGHYRADIYGENLNRLYVSPDPDRAPAIFAAKTIVEEMNNQGRLFLYLDLHAHASKRGCFFFGNHLADPVDQLFNTLYPRLVSLYSPHVDIMGNNFSEKNMHAKDRRDKEGSSKDGAGRVGMYNLTGCTLCYTLECNYNTDARPSRSPYDPSRKASKLKGDSNLESWRYTPSSWENVGHATLLGLLDLVQCNPYSRLEESEWKTYKGAQKSALRRLCCQAEYKDEAKKFLEDMSRMPASNVLPKYSPSMLTTLNVEIMEYLEKCHQQMPVPKKVAQSARRSTKPRTVPLSSRLSSMNRSGVRNTLQRTSSLSSTNSRWSYLSSTKASSSKTEKKMAISTCVVDFPQESNSYDTSKSTSNMDNDVDTVSAYLRPKRYDYVRDPRTLVRREGSKGPPCVTIPKSRSFSLDKMGKLSLRSNVEVVNRYTSASAAE